jgi:hypothetical protein
MFCDVGADLSSKYQVNPNQIADCWAAFSINKNLDHLDVRNFESFRLHVVKNYEGTYGSVAPGAVVTRSIKRPVSETIVPSVTPPPKKIGTHTTTTTNNTSRRISVSPDTKTPLSIPSAVKLPDYGDRRDRGKTIFTFNPENLQRVACSKQRQNPKCYIEYHQFETNVKEKTRHMFTTMNERAIALDRHLVELGDAIVDKFHLGREVDGTNETYADVVPIEAVFESRQGKICCLGRICNAVSET